MIFLKKYWFICISFSLISLFFLTRLYNILGLPIFTDEAIYIHWAQVAGNDASWRFISLTDGKGTLYVWIAMILLKFISNPLLAGRIVSIIAGFLSMIGIFFLTSEIFKNKKIGLLAGLLYILFPFALVYDRMALYEALVSMFIIWSLYFEVLLVRHIRLDLAMILGMVIGAGMLTKADAEFAFAFLPVSLLLFNFTAKKRRIKLLLWIIYSFVVLVIAEGIYNILRLSPFFYIIDQKTATFVYPIRDWIQHPFLYFSSNFSGLTSWLVGYVTVPFLILVASSFLVSPKFFRERLVLLIAFILPFVYLTFFGRTIYPRFLLFMTMPLIVLAAYGLYWLLTLSRHLYIQMAVFVGFLTLFVMTDFFIITNFARATIPDADKSQFLSAWPSGVGVNETVEFLRQQAVRGKIYVGTEGTFGLMPYALQIYLYKNPNIIINGFWPIQDTPPADVIANSKAVPTYFVFYQSCPSCQKIGVAPLSWPVKQIFQIKKLAPDTFYTLYQMK